MGQHESVPSHIGKIDAGNNNLTIPVASQSPEEMLADVASELHSMSTTGTQDLLQDAVDVDGTFAGTLAELLVTSDLDYFGLGLPDFGSWDFMDYTPDLSDPSRPSAENSPASNHLQGNPSILQCNLCLKRFTH